MCQHFSRPKIGFKFGKSQDGFGYMVIRVRSRLFLLLCACILIFVCLSTMAARFANLTAADIDEIEDKKYKQNTKLVIQKSVKAFRDFYRKRMKRRTLKTSKIQS